jgi:hypothetical protein
MALQYLVLKEMRVGFGDTCIGQDAETRVDAIHRSIVADDIGDVLVARVDLCDGLRGKYAFYPAFRKPDRRPDIKGIITKFKRMLRHADCFSFYKIDFYFPLLH